MAAYEEAIFRVYDRSMEGANAEDQETESLNRKTCETLEYILLGFTLTFALFVAVLHVAIVGKPGCLPALLHERMLAENRSSLVPEDAILQINVDSRFYDNAEFNTNREVFDSTDDEIDMYDRRRLRSTTESSSAVDEFRRQLSAYEEGRDVFKRRHHTTLLGKIAGFASNWYNGDSREKVRGRGLGRQVAPSGYDSGRALNDGGSGSSSSSNSSIASNSTASNNTEYGDFDPKYFQPFDFEYAYDIGVMSLSDKNRAKHGFTIINVTMEGEQCFGNGFIQSLIPFGGIDNVVLNGVMHTFNRKGALLSSRNDFYSWRESDLRPYFNAGTWLGYKVGLAMKILFSYFLLSCSTAVLVRILISSGVVLVFPIFSLMQYVGIVHDVDQHLRVISHAYPWLGIPMEMLLARGHSTIPFVMAHISRVVVYYSLYEALQFAVSIWFYDDPQPGQRELWLFATMMIWEYFSMVYVRAYTTILLFPRATLAAYALYHIYMYSFPGGFHMLVLFVMFLLTGWLMLFCMRKYENEAYQRGIVNADQPRQLYNRLPYPVWQSALAPDFTLFLPLQYRSSSIYAEPVGDPAAGGSGGAAPSGAGVAGATTEGAAASSTADADSSAGASGESEGVEMRSVPRSSREMMESMGLLHVPGGRGPGSYARLNDTSGHSSHETGGATQPSAGAN